MIDPHNLPTMPALMIAGPGELNDPELEAAGTQIIAHYGELWTQLHNETVAGVGKLLGCADLPYLIPGTGTTGVEIALVNVFEPGDKVVVADTGFFGNRLVEVAKAIGLDVTVIPIEPGAPIDPERLAQSAEGAAGIVTVHVETSTGVRHPVAEITDAAHGVGAIYVCDGIAAAGAETLDVDGMGIDVYITGTQKGLESPAGMAIVGLGKGGRSRLSARKTPVMSWYQSLATWDRYRDEWGPWHPHPVTMPSGLILAVASSLQRIEKVGIDRWIADRSELARRCREGLTELGMKPVPQPGVEANLVVAAWAEDAPALQARLLKQGFMISGGLGPTHGKAIRVGLMGRNATEDMVDRLLDAIRTG